MSGSGPSGIVRSSADDRVLEFALGFLNDPPGTPIEEMALHKPDDPEHTAFWMALVEQGLAQVVHECKASGGKRLTITADGRERLASILAARSPGRFQP